MTDTELADFDSLWDYDKPDESEARFRALLPAAEAAGDRSYHAQLLTQIARAEGLQRKYADSHATLDVAQALLDDSMPRAHIRYLLERGRVFNSSGAPAQARPFFLEALAQAEATHEDFYAIDAAHMMAIIEPPEQQIVWNERALAMAEQSSDVRAQGWRGSLYNNLAWTYHDLAQYEQALATFGKALEWQEATGDPSAIRIARWSVARTLRSLGRYDEALSILHKLEQGRAKTGEPGGYVYEEIGECLLAQGRAADAAPYFGRAYTILVKDPYLAEHVTARLARMKELSQVQAKTGD